jgi:hypothetical protein
MMTTWPFIEDGRGGSMMPCRSSSVQSAGRAVSWRSTRGIDCYNSGLTVIDTFAPARISEY